MKAWVGLGTKPCPLDQQSDLLLTVFQGPTDRGGIIHQSLSGLLYSTLAKPDLSFITPILQVEIIYHYQYYF